MSSSRSKASKARPEPPKSINRATLPEGTWLGSAATASAFALLLVLQAFLPGAEWKTILSTRSLDEQRFSSLDAEALPERVGPLVRGKFETTHREWDNSWGEQSRIWAYNSPKRKAILSLDYVFVGWHELTECYLGQGWSIIDYRIEPGDAGGGPGSTVVADLRTPDGRAARLIYGLFERSGRGLIHPKAESVQQALADRLARWVSRGHAPEVVGASHQIQLFVEGSDFTDEEMKAFRALFTKGWEAAEGRPAGQSAAQGEKVSAR